MEAPPRKLVPHSLWVRAVGHVVQLVSLPLHNLTLPTEAAQQRPLGF